MNKKLFFATTVYSLTLCNMIEYLHQLGIMNGSKACSLLLAMPFTDSVYAISWLHGRGFLCFCFTLGVEVWKYHVMINTSGVSWGVQHMNLPENILVLCNPLATGNTCRYNPALISIAVVHALVPKHNHKQILKNNQVIFKLRFQISVLV